MKDTEICPRCGSLSLENLATRSRCWECGFNPYFDSELSAWENLELRSTPCTMQTSIWHPMPG